MHLSLLHFQLSGQWKRFQLLSQSLRSSSHPNRGKVKPGQVHSTPLNASLYYTSRSSDYFKNINTIRNWSKNLLVIFGFAVICEIKVTQCIKITSIMSPFSSETFSNTLCGSNTYFQYFFVIIIKFDKKSHPLNERKREEAAAALPVLATQTFGEWSEQGRFVCIGQWPVLS